MILYESFVKALGSEGLHSDMFGNACFILLVCSRMGCLKMDKNVAEMHNIKTETINDFVLFRFVYCVPVAVVDISSSRTRQR